MVIIDALALLTGYTIFPVLMDRNQMSLILRRIEHYEQYQWYGYDHRRFSYSPLVTLKSNRRQ
jgi:hypothetical protein